MAVRVFRLLAVEESLAFQLLLVLHFVRQHACLLVAALVEHFDRHGAVLDLVRGPSVQADIDAPGAEGRNVGDEDENVTD